MIEKKELPVLALMLSLLVAGCTADAADEADAASEDELTSLATAEVVGSLTSDWYAGEAAAPTAEDATSYRAFTFEAYAGQKLAAYVVANDDSDPVAYILDSRHRMLKRNDDRDATVKDAAIEFTPPATGTYYLAFRTKERRPATVMARIIDDEVGGLRTRSFADGWPVRQRRSGESEYSYDRAKHAVAVRANAARGGTSITNASGCPADPFVPGAGLPVSGSAWFTIDPVAKRISLDGGFVGGSADIAPDGSFDIHSPADRWGFKRARGRVAAGGFVIVAHAETMECHSNYAGDTVHGADRFDAAIGAADPNYR